jgi:hypothetical protein
LTIDNLKAAAAACESRAIAPPQCGGYESEMALQHNMETREGIARVWSGRKISSLKETFYILSADALIVKEWNVFFQFQLT